MRRLARCSLAVVALSSLVACAKLATDGAAPSEGAKEAEQTAPKDDVAAKKKTDGLSNGLVAKPTSTPTPQASVATTVTSPKVPAIDETTHGGETILDPNARYATTYRPGLGHLAAFEAAIAKGQLPPEDRSIVADVGGRYAPTFALDPDASLGVRANLERGSMTPGGGALHLRLGLASGEGGARPHLSIHLVLDVSGSMQGAALDNARAAAKALVGKLADDDDFSMVTFASDARVLVGDEAVGPNRTAILAAIDTVHVEGGTNIGAGLTLGYQQAESKAIPEDAMRVVLFLSDGEPNVGITNPRALEQLSLDAFQHGVETSSFGLGDSYDGELMSTIAEGGAGGYYYLRDGSAIAPALATEVDARMHAVATAVEVRVRLKKDVDLLRVYGSHALSGDEAAIIRAQEVAADDQAKQKLGIDKNRQDDLDGGIRFYIPAFAPNDGHAILMKLHLPAGASTKDVATIELKYKDVVHKKNVVSEVPLSIAYASSDEASAKTADGSVESTVQGFAAGDALLAAANDVAKGDRTAAAALLAEEEGILRTAATTLSTPALAEDADRLAKMREWISGGASMSDPMLLSMVLETAGHARLR